MIMKVACFFSQHSPMLGHRRLDADPVGLFGRGGVGALRLLGMARTRIAEVENDGHAFTYGCGG